MKKIAIPTREEQVDDHFGHCEFYTIFTVENNAIVNEELIMSPAGCGCKSDIAPKLVNMGVRLMLAGGMGMGALNVLNYNGIEVVRGCSGNVHEVISLYLKGSVSDSGESCKSHENCN
jgi:predicted Fe-Mo cluster-binding NifX family protein